MTETPLPPEPWADTWRDYVRPQNWQNPRAEGVYNLIVIGAGAAGLVTAAGAAGLGARVALIERERMGGDCLNTGCVPSKALLRAARSVAGVTAAREFGLQTHLESVDFAQVMARLRRLRAQISEHDAAPRFQALGVDVFFGEALFLGGHHIQVADQRLSFKKAVIATGAQAKIPEIPGLRAAGFLTHENLFELRERPPRLACIGGGPIGCELAQALQRLGTQVTLLHNGPHLLSREDPEAAIVIEHRLRREGMALHLATTLEKVVVKGPEKLIFLTVNGQSQVVCVDQILVATGRSPRVTGLGLENVGVSVQTGGITVNPYLQTTHPDIYAAGDVCLASKFTHAADASARIVLQNALFMGRKKFTDLLIPRCTYTDPEIAQIGLSAQEAAAQHLPIETYTLPFQAVDRALIDAETEGFVKIHTRKGRAQIVGATLVGHQVGELLGELTLAMQSGVGLGRLSSIVHAYPTRSEILRRLGDQYNRTRLTPRWQSLLRHWLRWQRGA
jgi:pyruvate/2-oxoglutarate dehydrogenase complex dihydrolipoamide dehydrogenase (E3) component